MVLTWIVAGVTAYVGTNALSGNTGPLAMAVLLLTGVLAALGFVAVYFIVARLRRRFLPGWEYYVELPSLSQVIQSARRGRA